MKKISLGLLASALVFSFAGSGLAQEPVPQLISAPVSELNSVRAQELSSYQVQGMQKILSPEQIKNYKNIKKVGTTLMGVPVDQRGGQSGTEKIEKVQSNKPVQRASTTKLEKIAHPNELKNFEKIQKIGSALFGLRKVNAQQPVYIGPAAAPCVKEAISKKDLTLKASIASRSEQALLAIDARSSCQIAALGKETAKEQQAANKICVKNFQQTTLEINKTLDQVRNSSWSTFNADLKVCSGIQAATVVAGAEQVGALEIKIEDGGDVAEAKIE